MCQSDIREGGVAFPISRNVVFAARALALNELDPTLWHLQNDYTKITYEDNKVERGYILFFVRQAGLSQENQNKRIPQIRLRIKEMFEDKLASNVRILYLESPKTEPESEILLPHEWII